jgi:2-polyprenyl-6-hydroxyphenyl methylase/3-demethylubiquinone-9 3-methyltransferase
MSNQAPTGPTVDPAEIAKFSALAAQWWDPNGVFAALHRMNPVRLAYLRDRAIEALDLPGGGRTPLAGVRALDVGCGGGLLSMALARMGADVVAIDASPDSAGAARAYARQAGLEVDVRVDTAEGMAQTQPGGFDLVAGMEIIEHVADPAAFMAALSQLVRTGGLVLISTINRTARARMFAITVAERVLGWAEPGTHDYAKLITPQEIVAWTPDVRWGPPTGMSYDLLGGAWRLSSDVSMNYLMAGLKT